MYPVQEGDVLKRVSSYELGRRLETLNVSVEFVLTGKAAGQVHADARYKGVLIDADFWGYGATEGESLRDLLTKIRGVPFRDLIHPQDLHLLVDDE